MAQPPPLIGAARLLQVSTEAPEQSFLRLQREVSVSVIAVAIAVRAVDVTISVAGARRCGEPQKLEPVS